jgi:indolepyruvate ferredoxin oxidoreductase
MARALAPVALDDKYRLDEGRVYLTGTQALVRLCLLQRRRDRAHGYDTAGLVTGYRGSPLGTVDKEFWRAESFLKPHHVTFQAAVNEDLAATALWGSQQLHLFPGARYDGVFGAWYGKGPGVDRSGDVFRHANLAGTSPLGGVLVLTGDDPGCKSSTVPSSSEYALMDAQIPFFHPANVHEILEYGLYGWALSRFAGVWVGLKAVADNVDSSASVLADPGVRVTTPKDFAMPPGGLHIRWPDPPLEQEERLVRFKIPAALAFVRANALNRTVIDSPAPRLGIVATGKSYMDLRQALDDLGIDARLAGELGLRVLKVAVPWPLERESLLRFAEGLEEILVVEEKRPVIETQIKDALYHLSADVRPRVVGKTDEAGKPLLPIAGELSPGLIVHTLSQRLDRFGAAGRFNDRLALLESREKVLTQAPSAIKRIPYFCAGCPHNTSTKVPEGSRAVAGIGCHYMAIWMDRDTTTFTHMGGEGANWIGQAPFTDTRHVFVNLGDGTYFHSGLLAIRAAVAAKVNITYTILYNDAVAMTGGQPVDGPLDVPMITRQVQDEGIERIAVVSDEPEKYHGAVGFAPGVTFHHRDELDTVQRHLREWPGVSVLVYDQTCAAEKRRRRKRGLYPDPPKRAFINEAVCEGCGDCGVQSNCVSIVPVESELGRKRAIDQSSCNKDFSCLKGFCPSFVTVHGGQLRKRAGIGSAPFPALPEPALADASAPYSIALTGIGGTGVVTVAALLAMAAHLEGKGVSVLDVAGLAQKNGAVYSHIRIADDPERLHAMRIGLGGADLLLGCDLVTAAGADTLSKLRPGRSRAVVNTHEIMTAAFTHDPDLAFPERAFEDAIVANAAAEHVHFVDATTLATALLGDSIASNLFLVGFACQKGSLPVSAEAIERAIELNGVAVDFNKQAFLWGRRTAHDRDAVERLLAPKPMSDDGGLEGFIDRRAADLVRYQDATYAARYRALVERARAAEGARAKGKTGLVEGLAQGYYKLLAYKDEYEVARLYTDGAFADTLKRQFEGDVKLTFHLAPPLLAERDTKTGELKKREFGPWVMDAFRMLAKLKFLRGTPFDPFGYTAERRLERRLIRDYEVAMAEVLAGLSHENHALAVEIAGLPLKIRGFGHVKAKNLEAAKACEAQLLTAYREAKPQSSAAE